MDRRNSPAGGFAGRPLRLLAIAWASVFFAALSHAGTVYKWVDERGKVHYGDRPPATAAPSEVEIEDRQAPAPEDSDRREKTRRLLDAIESEREQEKEAEARERARAAQRKRNCAIAKRRVEILERANTVSVTDYDGERKYLDEAGRAKALAQARKLVREWC